MPYVVKYTNLGEHFGRTLPQSCSTIGAAWDYLLNRLKCAGRRLDSLTKVAIVPQRKKQSEGGTTHAT